MTHAHALERVLSELAWDQLPNERALAASALAEWLYRGYFIAWRPPNTPLDYAGSPWFVAELTSRCAGHSTFEPGFRLSQRADSGVFVENGSIRLWVTPHTPIRPARAKPGDWVEVAVPCARESALPGFFSIISRAGRLNSAAPHLKFYVNATPAGAVALLGGLLESPALRGARFEAKVTNEPARFGRRDTVLIYVRPQDAGPVARYLKTFSQRGSRALRPQTPPMTVPLFRGVGIAESPPHHAESFGAHRCRLVAEGLLTAHHEGRERLAAVRERFEREGLDWGAPWFGSLPRRWLNRLGS